MLNGPRPVIVNLLRAIGALLLFRLCCARVVWVRHNFRPHEPTANARWHRLLTTVMGAMADVVVTHRPVPGMKSIVVPHCLVAPPPDGDQRRDIDYLWFGLVRRYKAVDTLLREWPSHYPLNFMGRCDDTALTNEIREIIDRRGLMVNWANRYMPDAELDSALERARFVLISHDDGSMIVSGTFYHAVSKGANVVARLSGFAQHATEEHSFVTVYADGRLEASLQAAAYVAPSIVCGQAQARYGDAMALNAWRHVFEGTTV